MKGGLKGGVIYVPNAPTSKFFNNHGIWVDAPSPQRSNIRQFACFSASNWIPCKYGVESHVMGLIAKPGTLWLIRVSTRAMEDTFKKFPPALLVGHCVYGTTNVSPPAGSLQLLSLGFLNKEDKERLPNIQATQLVLFEHTGLSSSRAAMANNERDVTLNNLQASLRDIK